MGTVYLVRHAQASFGAADYDSLSETGHLQAAALGSFLLGHDIDVDHVVSGTLVRQRHSAELVADAFNEAGSGFPVLREDSRFDEFEAEKLIRLALPTLLASEPDVLDILQSPAENRREFQRIFSALVENWVSDDFGHEDLESWPDFRARVAAAISDLAAELGRDGTALVFTSGGVITAALREFGGVDDRRAFDWNWQIVNTSVSRLACRRKGIYLQGFNNYAHLELLKDPGLITYR